MRKLILKIGWFSIPIVVFCGAIELFYRFVPNDYSVKHATIPSKFKNTEVLIFGNSHTFYGLNPHYFDRPTFNLAFVSQTLYFDKLLFDTYISKFQNLKCVILHIEYTSLSELVATKENNWRKYYYRYYLKLNVPSISKFDIRKYSLATTRTINFNTKLMVQYCKEGSIVNCDSNGFGIDYTPEKSIKIEKKDALKRVENVEDHLMDFTENYNRIQSMITTCNKRGIKVIILNMPVTTYFSEAVNQTKLKKIQKTCSEIAQQNKNVTYLNLFQNRTFIADDFYDVDHLNTNGAKKCSLLVNRFLNAYLGN